MNPVPVLRGWARELSACVSGPRSWIRVLEAACVMYAVCALRPGILDLVAMFVGAFHYFVGAGAARLGAAINRTPGVVREALCWRYGSAATVA